MNDLTIIEKSQLTELEATIERGLQTFYEVGTALLSIRESRLYRADYDTFEAYCQKRWNMTRWYANRVIASAGVIENLVTIVTKENPLPLPATESQVRPLVQLEPAKQVEVWQHVVETVGNDKITARHVEQAVERLVKRVEKEEKAAARVEAKTYEKPQAHTTDLFNHCLLFTESVADCSLADDSVDIIITDPPYPKEFLSVYGDLAKTAQRILKPGGSMIVMIGQSYLPEILALMTPHIDYRWTGCYLTPGVATQLWQRKLNTKWKPLLWFSKGEYKNEWLGDDVFKSNGDDKNHHHWGQSESGMSDIVERFTYPKQTIYDPFCGGGTTGVVAVSMDRFFIGSDIAPDCIATTKQRIIEALNGN